MIISLLVLSTIILGSTYCLGLFWQRLFPDAPGIERFGAGLVLSAGVVLIISQVLRPMAGPRLQLLVFFAVMSAIWVLCRDSTGGQESKAPIVITTAIAAIPALTGMAGFWIDHPLGLDGERRYFVDIPFFQALSTGLHELGPQESIFVAGDSTRYHWFVYGWIGALESWSGSEPFLILTRLSPAVSIIGVASLTASLTWLCKQSRTAVFVAVALATTSTAFFRLGVGALLPEYSQSHSGSVAWMLLVVLIIVRSYRQVTLRLPVKLLILGTSAMAVGGKATHGAILIGGCASLFLAPGARRDARRIASSVLVLTTVGTLFTFLVFIWSSRGNGLELGFGSVAIPAIGIPIWASFRVLAWTGRLTPALFVSRIRQGSSLSVVMGLAPGMLVVGLAGFMITRQPGGSNSYFIYSATSVLVVIAGVGASEIWNHFGLALRRRAVLVTPIPILISYLWMSDGDRIMANIGSVSQLDTEKLSDSLTGPIAWFVCIFFALVISRERMVRLRLISILVLLTSIGLGAIDDARQAVTRANNPDAVLTESQAQAATFLREFVGDSEGIWLTNRFCESEEDKPPLCGGEERRRYFWVAASTGKQMFIEGLDFHYGLGALPESAEEKVHMSVEFSAAPNEELHSALWGAGVRGAWLDLTQPSAEDWSGFGDVLFDNDAVRIVKLTEP